MPESRIVEATYEAPMSRPTTRVRRYLDHQENDHDDRQRDERRDGSSQVQVAYVRPAVRENSSMRPFVSSAAV